jgi:peptidoglycan/LPS O-acetylase OafA/YrhL
MAVILVIADHVGLLVGGYLGVDVFLPLSGFLITALLYEEWDRTATISLRRFLARRAQRLLPALTMLVAGFGVLMVLLDPFPGLWSLGRLSATTLLFANNWVATLAPRHASVLGALSPTWTLAQEGQFYLLWPPMLYLLLCHRSSPRTVLTALGGAIAVLLVLSPLCAHADPSFNIYTSPFDRGAELLLGAGAAIVWRERWVPRPLPASLVGWLVVGALAFVVLHVSGSEPGWYMTAAVLATLLILQLMSARGEPGLLARALGCRPLAATGRVSYGIYLFHVPIYYLLWAYLPLGSPARYFPVVLGLSIAAAALSWKLVEAPALHGRWGELCGRLSHACVSSVSAVLSRA